MRIFLDVLEGPNRGRSLLFDRRQLEFLGRAADCGAYCLPEDTDVSRKHAMIDFNPPRCSIRDLGSTNYTFINGKRIHSGDLVEGDVIKLGANTIILVRIEGKGLPSVFEEEDQFVESA